ncbi:hypothetical protein [Nocardia cyriacigeorgica]|uniref:hypothetical protein n=1 Tax=Nocardia cyriacigeorgica TaxID=135487 RepID=UPI0024544ED8|nr:hypothetical protein [Nocardia cyriacigeorgica]
MAGLLSAGLGNHAARAMETAGVNGYTALIQGVGGEIDTVIAMRVDDGLITGLYSVRNPAKLSRVRREVSLRR